MCIKYMSIYMCMYVWLLVLHAYIHERWLLVLHAYIHTFMCGCVGVRVSGCVGVWVLLLSASTRLCVLHVHKRTVCAYVSENSNIVAWIAVWVYQRTCLLTYARTSLTRASFTHAPHPPPNPTTYLSTSYTLPPPHRLPQPLLPLVPLACFFMLTAVAASDKCICVYVCNMLTAGSAEG